MRCEKKAEETQNGVGSREEYNTVLFFFFYIIYKKKKKKKNIPFSLY